jgi:hypothetical protein
MVSPPIARQQSPLRRPQALAAAPSVTRVIFCCFSDASARLHAQALDSLDSPCAD